MAVPHDPNLDVENQPPEARLTSDTLSGGHGGSTVVLGRLCLAHPCQRGLPLRILLPLQNESALLVFIISVNQVLLAVLDTQSFVSMSVGDVPRDAPISYRLSHSFLMIWTLIRRSTSGLTIRRIRWRPVFPKLAVPVHLCRSRRSARLE